MTTTMQRAIRCWHCIYGTVPPSLHLHSVEVYLHNLRAAPGIPQFKQLARTSAESL